MTRRPTIALLLLLGTTAIGARAGAATLSFTTTLQQASGAFHIGDAVSFTGVFDETQSPYLFFPPALAYNSFSSSTLTIAGTTFENNPWYFAFYDPKTSILSFGGVGDYNFKPLILVDLARSDPNDVALPTTAELAGKSGSISFDYYTAPAASGSGYATFPPAVPEPASWALMIGGLAATGWAMRRRTAAVGA